jgi:hypothetical protein
LIVAATFAFKLILFVLDFVLLLLCCSVAANDAFVVFVSDVGVVFFVSSIIAQVDCFLFFIIYLYSNHSIDDCVLLFVRCYHLS